MQHALIDVWTVDSRSSSIDRTGPELSYQLTQHWHQEGMETFMLAIGWDGFRSRPWVVGHPGKTKTWFLSINGCPNSGTRQQKMQCKKMSLKPTANEPQSPCHQRLNSAVAWSAGSQDPSSMKTADHLVVSSSHRVPKSSNSNHYW